MEAKLIAVLALVAVAHSAVLPSSGFSYEVANPGTGDYKKQLESRVDGAVYGHYSVQEPDGSKRIVSYIADQDGFNAVVRKCPADWARLADAVPAVAAAPASIATPAAVNAARPAVIAARTPAVVPGVVDARLYPAVYSAGPSVVPSWPYGSPLN